MARLYVRLAAEVDGPQVVEHADHDLAVGDGVEDGWRWGHVHAGHLAAEVEALLFVEEFAVVVDVDEGLEVLFVVADDEVAGEADAGHRHVEAIGDGEIDDGEGDGDALAGGDHLVDAAIAGVVVVRLVAGEALFAEEEFVEDLEAFDGVVLHAHAGVDFGGVGVEDVEEGTRVEIGKLNAAEFEGGQIERCVGVLSSQ